MELKILHLVPEMMSLYGEYANLSVLNRKLTQMGAAVTIVPVSCDETPDFSDADMIYMGAGTERSQKAALSRLLPHAAALKAAEERGAVILFTGNAMETLGKSITDAAGTVCEGLALAEFATVESEKRDPCDVIAASSLWDAPAVGVMNKCSVTTGVETPLFPSLSLGFGNETALGAEGYVHGNTFATHITGPVLVKNPAFADLIIARLFALKNLTLPETLPILPHEREAYAVTLRELQDRVK